MFTAGRLRRCTLIQPQAVEERQQVDVREPDEGDGTHVTVGSVHRHARVDSEEDGASHRQPREACAMVVVPLGLGILDPETKGSSLSMLEPDGLCGLGGAKSHSSTILLVLTEKSPPIHPSTSPKLRIEISIVVDFLV